jgi:hypothetical protein
MAEANKRKRDDGAIKTLFSNYAEVVFYECMFSAQFTANIQILFRIDDIVLKLPPDSFAARFPEIKQKALEKIQKNVNDWKRSLDPTTMAFFDTNDLSKAIAVVAQKGTLNVTFSDKVIKLPVKDTSVSCIMAAIDLLRYPLARMETIQSNRQGALLDLEKDATFITAMHDDCTIQADKILHSLELLQTDSMPKRPKKSEKADK